MSEFNGYVNRLDSYNHAFQGKVNVFKFISGMKSTSKKAIT